MPLITTNVTSSYVDPSLTAQVNEPVIATLMGETTTLSGTSVLRQESTRTNSNGTWVLSLLPNSLFDGISYYVIQVGIKERYEVIVPVTVDSAPVELNTILRGNTVAEEKSIFTGTMDITGDLVVNGNVDVSGLLSAGSIQEFSMFYSGEVPTFPGSLEIVGNLIVSGALIAKGSVASGS